MSNRQQDYPYQPVPFTDVTVADAFWAPRIETNRTVTIPYDFQKCKETGRVDNFDRAAGKLAGPFEGIRFNDSDVFKVIEGAAYSLNLRPDAELDAYLDELIAKIAAAQEPDGYIYTCRTIDPVSLPRGAGVGRWSQLKDSHELYNVGHMYEAAVAHHLATGKRSFLEIAIKNADLIDSVFGPGKNRGVPGHEEIEIGLAKLYRATGEERYLRLAQFFLDERGRTDGHELYGAYAQDHLPVTEQSEAVGHSVRAGYLYAGMADVAALAGDQRYVRAIDRIWEDVVQRKLYLTGGIGARHEGEAFGEPYELPNATAYTETCAAIANMMWNHRLFLLHGEAKYIDVLERTLYNGYLAGVSFGGREFFYPNPLESDGQYAFNHGATTRQPWFGCSCCPTNVVRIMPSLGGYVYAVRDDSLYVNLYVGGSAMAVVAGAPVRVTQATAYPWSGDVHLILAPERSATFALRLRLPGWALGQPVPSDLYRYLPLADAPRPTLRVNGQPAAFDTEAGYAVIRRAWQPGDVVELALPMPVRRVVSHPALAENAGKVALERGPLVYCAEWPDNALSPLALALADDAPLGAERRPDLLGGVTVITGTARQGGRLTAIPYYAWAHRGAGEMAVWLRRA